MNGQSGMGRNGGGAKGVYYCRILYAIIALRAQFAGLTEVGGTVRSEDKKLKIPSQPLFNADLFLRWKCVLFPFSFLSHFLSLNKMMTLRGDSLGAVASSMLAVLTWC